MRISRIQLASLVSLMLIPFSANATYSIIAVDSATGQVGAVVASCVGNVSLAIAPGFAPGKGVAIAQARLDSLSHFNKELAVQKIVNGASAAEALQFLTRSTDLPEAHALAAQPPTPEIITKLSEIGDPQLGERQFAVVTFSEAVNFTGLDTFVWSGARSGRSGTFRYSAQGNTLTSEKVVQQAAFAFEKGSGSLATRLLNSIEGGSMNEEGDSRCTGLGSASNSAYIKVVNSDGSVHIEVEVLDSPSAVHELRNRIQPK